MGAWAAHRLAEVFTFSAFKSNHIMQNLILSLCILPNPTQGPFPHSLKQFNLHTSYL